MEKLMVQISGMCFHTLRFVRSPLVHSSTEIKAGQNQERNGVRTYQTATGLRVTAAGVAVAVAPLTGAQVEARAWPGVTFFTLLQQRGKTPQVRDKWWQHRGICLCSTAGRHTAIIIKERNRKRWWGVGFLTSSGTCLPSLFSNLKIKCQIWSIKSSSANRNRYKKTDKRKESSSVVTAYGPDRMVLCIPEDRRTPPPPAHDRYLWIQVQRCPSWCQRY